MYSQQPSDESKLGECDAPPPLSFLGLEQPTFRSIGHGMGDEPARSFNPLMNQPVMRSIGGGGDLDVMPAHNGFWPVENDAFGGYGGLGGSPYDADKFGQDTGYKAAAGETFDLPSLGAASHFPTDKQKQLDGGLESHFAGLNLVSDTFSSPAPSNEGLEALEPVPQYYEKYSSFLSKAPHGVLLASLDALLSQSPGVDHQFKAHRHKIKGFANESSGRCTFKVQVYRTQDGHVLCEFQRRSGCVVSFGKFWRRTFHAMAAHVAGPPATVASAVAEVSAEGAPAANGSGPLTAPPLDISTMDMPEDDGTAGVTLDDETVTNLFSMAGSDNVDVQREGAAALASVSQQTANQARMATAKNLSTLMQKLVASSDEELCRQGCVFLANMCQCAEVRGALTKQMLGLMLAVLEGPRNMGSKDSKRHVARALCECSKTEANAVMSHPQGPQCVSTLQRFMNDEDAALRTSVMGALCHLTK